jgi:acylphosphatase
MRHLNIKVSGRVQGVFFRACTRDAAEALGVCGFVRNEPDGSVYIEAEAQGETLEKFVQWCWLGSPGSRVTAVAVREGAVTNFHDFRVAY